MKKRVLLFGTGSTGRRIYTEVKDSVEVLGFLDNDESKWGDTVFDLPVFGNGVGLREDEFDEIIVCSLPGLYSIQKQLLNEGISGNKINTGYISTQVNARINFIRDYSMLLEDSISENIAVAEGGVYRGDFAKEINACFPKHTLYLFDTFEGFDERDVKIEKQENYSSSDNNHLRITSEELVLGCMPHPEMVVMKKGYFPETAVGLEDNKYLFVNLDFDLYNPTIEGLRYFYPRVVEGGVILVHDFYNSGYAGVKQAIDDFERENGVTRKYPIGDHCSIALLK